MNTYRDAILARRRHEERLRTALQQQAVRQALAEAGYTSPPLDSPRTMHGFTRFVFWFVGLNALLGAAALLFFPRNTDSLFFWMITPPINAALFGALYLAGGIAVIACARHGDWGTARVLIPILVSAGLLISAVTLLHLDRFATGLRLGYWLGVYVGAPLLALLVYWLQERRAAPQTAATPLMPATRRLAALIGVALLGLGGLLLARPEPLAAVWPWPITVLMVRIFAAWFSAFGVGLLWFLIETDWERLVLLPNMLIGTASLDLIVILLYRNQISADGLRFQLYIAHLLGLILVGAALHLVQRHKPADDERRAHGRGNIGWWRPTRGHGDIRTRGR